MRPCSKIHTSTFGSWATPSHPVIVESSCSKTVGSTPGVSREETMLSGHSMHVDFTCRWPLQRSKIRCPSFSSSTNGGTTRGPSTKIGNNCKEIDLLHEPCNKHPASGPSPREGLSHTPDGRDWAPLTLQPLLTISTLLNSLFPSAEGQHRPSWSTRGARQTQLHVQDFLLPHPPPPAATLSPPIMQEGIPALPQSASQFSTNVVQQGMPCRYQHLVQQNLVETKRTPSRSPNTQRDATTNPMV